MKWILYGIVYIVFGAIVLFTITMLVTSLYAFLWWDMDAWMTVIEWLNPKDNVIVRVVSIIGSCLAMFGGWIAYQLNG